MRYCWLAGVVLCAGAGLSCLGIISAAAQNVNGAGATFPYPIYSRWFAEFNQLYPGVRINYQSIGSGGGIRQVGEGTVDFGATDGPMSDAQMRAAKVRTVHIPTVLGAVVPAYNLPGVAGDLHFSEDALAGIYLGKITRWNSPYLLRENPGVSLPDKEILPIYRSDSSGTTYIFTDYLAKISPEWQGRVGRATSVKWPVGIGQKGNEGVAGMVRQIPYSIGYVELIFAEQNHMQYGAVHNRAGRFIRATTVGVTAAAAASLQSIPADYRVSITNAPGADSYPISSFTWLLIPAEPRDPAKGRALHGFLEWMLTRGEQEASSMTYAPLPAELIARVKQTVATLR